MSAICLAITLPSSGVEVYVGVADQWMDLIKSPDEWRYVRQNADGLYLNFIQMGHDGGVGFDKQETCNAYANLFTHKNAFYESDTNETMQKEQDYLLRLQAAGFTIPYTSLNYGMIAERQSNLKTYALPQGQAQRLCICQNGPWDVGGKILGDTPAANLALRSNIAQSDGASTDGPMGYWHTDQGSMRAGSYSMVKYAHSLGKKAVVMICPYHANVAGYDPTKDFLAVGQSCVRMHEDNDADPDIWSVFEYATTIAAVPEQISGAPAISSTGMAYYLIKHLKGDPGTLDLSAKTESGTVTGQGAFSPAPQVLILDPSLPAGTVYHYKIHIANTSAWCDYAAMLKSTTGGSTATWKVSYKLSDTDITSSVMGGGHLFYKDNRVNPNTTLTVDLYLKRTGSTGDANFDLNLELLPHQGSEAVDSLKILSRSAEK